MLKLRDYLPAMKYGAKVLPNDTLGFEPTFWGKTYWVKKSTDTDYADFRDKYDETYDDGTHTVQTTLEAAVAAASKNDRIILLTPDSGAHDLSDTVTITTFGLQIFGDSFDELTQRTTIKNPTTSSGNDMFLVKADKVVFAGLTFQNRKAGKCIAIGDTAGQAYYQITVKNCNFTDYGGVATYGVAPGNMTDSGNSQFDTVNLTVRDCMFDGFVTAAIVANGTRDAYINNRIIVPDSGIGIALTKAEDSRGNGVIRGNYIQCKGTSSGIVVTNAGSAAGTHCIAENTLQGATTKITTQTYLQGYDNNEAAAATGAKTAIDIVT